MILFELKKKKEIIKEIFNITNDILKKNYNEEKISYNVN